MSKTDVSALTITRGRDDHLRNVIKGLARQTFPPDELLIGRMQDQAHDDLPDAPFPIRQIHVHGDELPLAAARNAVARAAFGKDLVFLDVDCIPAPTLIEDYRTALRDFEGLLMGEVMYLPADAGDEGWTFAAFDRVAERHSDRRGPPPEGIEICGDYRCFWSLNFAMPSALFARIGGFDERYVGYGGEDTDFGKMLDQAGIPIAWMKGAKAYHQYHQHHMPPVHHLRSIIRNSLLFRRKWGYLTMGHWLHAFELLGLITPTATGFRILREPRDQDYVLTGQNDRAYVNTASVVRALAARQQEPREERDLEPALA